jgi:peptidoglycan hydrolase-like protein with peptidoglycan-binding domain/muramidase (phage lysozyme)
MKILDIILEATEGQIYSIGDSHAEGLAYDKRITDYAQGGQHSTQPSNFSGTYKKHPTGVNNVPDGSSVIVAQGCNDAANSSRAHMDSKGKTPLVPPQTIANNVVKIVQALQAKKCKVVFVLFPNGDPAKKPYYGGEYQDKVRQAIKAAVGVPVIDLEGKGLGPDGVHATPGAYLSAAKEAIQALGTSNLKSDNSQKIAPPVIDMKSGQDNGAPSAATQSLSIPNGNINPEVADIQKVLLALGYKLPRHGVDGVRGPETRRAIEQFQKDNGLQVDGDPGPETVTALNKLITSKNIKFTKSTDADVKKENTTAFTGRKRKADAAPMPELQMDSVTKGKVGKVLDLVASKESAGYYDIMNGGKRFPEILDMTFAQLKQFQDKHANKALKRSSAAGRYQIMGFNNEPKNSYVQKAGLDYNKDLFSPENQDKIGIVFLRECGLQSWLAGTMSNEAFLDKIARIWMAFADSKGVSPHAGDGYNGQGIGPKWTLSALDRIQNSTA